MPFTTLRVTSENASICINALVLLFFFKYKEYILKVKFSISSHLSMLYCQDVSIISSSMHNQLL